MRYRFASCQATSRQPRDRGAVLVEAALAIPLLLLVVLGSIEAGMAWDAKSGTTNALRSGVLRGASIGDRPETDLRILQSVIGEVGADDVARLEWVIVFDGDSNGGNHTQTVNECAAAISAGGIAGGGGSSRCVVYPPSVLQQVADSTLTLASFDNGGSASDSTGYLCNDGTGVIDSKYCAPSRTFGGVDAQVGIALQYSHEWTTGIFPFDPPVMREIGVSSTFVNDGAEIQGTTTFALGNETAYDAGGFGTGVPLNSGTVSWTDQHGNSDLSVGTTPDGSTYLGPFAGNDGAVLSVSDLPAHTEICVTFELYIFGSHDGHKDAGESISVDVGNDGSNEWSDRFKMGDKKSEVNGIVGQWNALGYDSSNSVLDSSDPSSPKLKKSKWSKAQVFQVGPVCGDHFGADGSSAQIHFDGEGYQALNDEAWMLGDVQVTTSVD